jgi:hypothetical protein
VSRIDLKKVVALRFVLPIRLMHQGTGTLEITLPPLPTPMLVKPRLKLMTMTILLPPSLTHLRASHEDLLGPLTSALIFLGPMIAFPRRPKARSLNT